MIDKKVLNLVKFFWRLFNENTDKQSNIETKYGWHKANFGGNY